MLSRDDAIALTKDLLDKFRREQERLDRIDRWFHFSHEAPHQPRHATREYRDLRDRAQTPWLELVVTSVAQALYVDGYRRSDEEDNLEPWEWWQLNGLDARQVAVHRAALGYGLAYVTCMPGEDELTGDAVPAIRGHSPRRMMAFYEEPEYDDWPLYAIRVRPHGSRWLVRLFDDEATYNFTADNLTMAPRPILQQDADTGMVGIDPAWREPHTIGVCPVIRFANAMDLEGRVPGEVEPLISVASRIDQTTFDRIIVQRFGAWVVRTIAGMAKPEGLNAEETAKLELRISDLLVAEDTDTKFGSLPATPLDGYIKAHEADIRALAAVSQTPAHELLGQMANLSAEALAAARASLTAKVDERQVLFGEAWEQTLRLAAHIMGDREGASDMEAQVRWRDTEIRSLAQAADALGKLAQMLEVPVELLWEKIPAFTQQDVERAKDLFDKEKAEQLRLQLEQRPTPGSPGATPAPAPAAPAPAA